MCARFEVDVVVNWDIRELAGFLVSLLSLHQKGKKNSWYEHHVSVSTVCARV
jgi:hypothetical protein